MGTGLADQLLAGHWGHWAFSPAFSGRTAGLLEQGLRPGNPLPPGWPNQAPAVRGPDVCGYI